MALLEHPKGTELVMGLGSCRRAAGIEFEGTHRSTPDLVLSRPLGELVVSNILDTCNPL